MSFWDKTQRNLTLKYFCKNHGDLSALFEYLCRAYTAIINILLFNLSGGIDNRRHILTSIVDPRAEWVDRGSS